MRVLGVGEGEREGVEGAGIQVFALREAEGGEHVFLHLHANLPVCL